MAEAILDLRLDTVQPNRVRLVYGVQNDYNSRYICARFTVNGKPIDIEKTAAVRINAKRPDGNKDAFPGTVNTDGTAKVPVAQWMLEVPGEVSASITAVTTGGALTTQEFYIMAKASIWDSTGEPSAENPDKDVLQTIIASENERVAAESTRVANENARITAENARAEAETLRLADEATRVANEAERVSAESVRKAEFATWSEEVGKISAFDKRLTNLEAAVSPEIVTPVTDSTVAYSKTVPANVLPNAAVCEIGGMSYKCENLLPKTKAQTQGGVTITVNDDGSFTLNGTATADIYFTVNSAELDAGTYTLNGGFKGGSWERYMLYCNNDASWVCNGRGATYEWKGGRADFNFAVYSGVTLSNLTVYPMLNKGETALPYQPYFTGLRDSKVEAIESVGVNKLDYSNPIYLSNCIYKNGEIKQISADTANVIFKLGVFLDDTLVNDAVTNSTVDTTGYLMAIFKKEKTFNRVRFGLNGSQIDTLVTYDVSNLANGKTYYLRVYFANIEQGSIAWRNMGIYESNNIDFAPYFRKAFPIPEAVQNLDGYGQGVNAEYHNKIVLDPLEGVKKYRQVCAKRAYEDGDENLANAITDGTKETVYELATPVETDVSHLFTDDNLLPVEAGGTITAVNEFEHEVPFTIEYTVKGA